MGRKKKINRKATKTLKIIQISKIYQLPTNYIFPIMYMSSLENYKSLFLANTRASQRGSVDTGKFQEQ